MRLELPFAAELVAAGMSALLPQEVEELARLSAAIETVMGGYIHVQGATYALVHAFLWDRFGR